MCHPGCLAFRYGCHIPPLCLVVDGPLIAWNQYSWFSLFLLDRAVALSWFLYGVSLLPTVSPASSWIRPWCHLCLAYVTAWPGVVRGLCFVSCAGFSVHRHRQVWVRTPNLPPSSAPFLSWSWLRPCLSFPFWLLVRFQSWLVRWSVFIACWDSPSSLAFHVSLGGHLPSVPMPALT